MLNVKSFLTIDFGAGSLKLAEFEINELGGLRLKTFVIKPLGAEGSAPFIVVGRRRRRLRILPGLAQKWFQRRMDHAPTLGMETQGSLGGNGEPFCSSSMECLSGERTKAMLPSRGGRLMVTPAFISRSQSA